MCTRFCITKSHLSNIFEAIFSNDSFIIVRKSVPVTTVSACPSAENMLAGSNSDLEHVSLRRFLTVSSSNSEVRKNSLKNSLSLLILKALQCQDRNRSHTHAKMRRIFGNLRRTPSVGHATHEPQKRNRLVKRRRRVRKFRYRVLSPTLV